jgi:hypothetical protein
MRARINDAPKIAAKALRIDGQTVAIHKARLPSATRTTRRLKPRG